jgi:tetratricopeptide (TPR) repeat protein
MRYIVPFCLTLALVALPGGAQTPPKPSPSATPKVKNPQDARKSYEIGTQMLLKKRFQEALVRFDAALEANPGFVKAHALRGVCYFVMDDPRKALVELDTALELDPENALSQWARGQVYFYLGDSKQAIKDYDRFLKNQPENAPGYFFRAVAQYRLGQMGPCITDASKSIAYAPQNADAFALRGAAYLRQDHKDSAMEDFKAAAEKQPDNGLYQSLLYVGSVAAGKPDLGPVTNYVKTTANHKWPYPVAQVLTSSITPDQCLKLASSSFSRKIDKEMATHQAHFFIGWLYRAKGDEVSAKKHIDQALSNELNLFLVQDQFARLRLEKFKD